MTRFLKPFFPFILMTFNPLWIPAITSGISFIGKLFKRKKKQPERRPVFQYKEDPLIQQARSQLYTKLFTGAPTYVPISEAEKQRALEDVETQARKLAEGKTFGLSRRGLLRSSILGNLLTGVEKAEAKEKADLSQRIADINAQRKLEAKRLKRAQQLSFLTGQQARDIGLAEKRYSSEVGRWESELEPEEDTGSPLETLGSLAALLFQTKSSGIGTKGGLLTKMLRQPSRMGGGYAPTPIAPSDYYLSKLLA
jgi:hypothetical protein